MKIGCLQFAPLVGDIDNNLNRADAVLNRCDPDDLDNLDLLVLPELAFTGYNFKSLKDISPFLEPSKSGISALWARTVALKYDCTVVVGYPEIVDPSPKWPTGPEYYNAAIVVNGEGETVANYRKTHLYQTDETWALEGDTGFYRGYLAGLGGTAMGICMDLNPYRFEAPWHAFEFAFHVLEVRADLVIVSMAWMTREDHRLFSRMPQEPDMDTLMYWVTRLEPIIRAEHEDEIIFVFANRTGTEDEAVYAGTSAVLGIKDGEVRVYGILGRGEKKVLVVDTDVAPYARLTYTTESRPAQAQPAQTVKGPPPLGQTAAQSNEKTSDQQDGSKSSPRGDKKDEVSTSPHPSNSVRSSSRGSRGTASSRTVTKKLSVKTDWETLNKSKKGESPTIPTPSMPTPTPSDLRPHIPMPWAESMTMVYLGLDSPSVSSFQLELAQANGFYENNLNSLVSTSKTGWKPKPDRTPVDGSRPSQFETSPLVSADKERLAGMSESSPSSSELYWVPANHLLQTPIEGKVRIPSTTSDLLVLSDKSAVIRRSSADPSLSKRNQDTAVGNRQPEGKEMSGTSRSASARLADDHTGSQQEEKSMPNRPSSPKSRNASRSRGPDRADSPFVHNADMNAIAKKLDEIAQRVESVQGRHTPMKGRVTPPRDSEENPIPAIAAQSSRSTPVPSSSDAMQDKVSDRPISDPSGEAARGRDTHRDAPATTQETQPGERTVSRGRQPLSNGSPAATRGQGFRQGSFDGASRGPPEPIDLSQFVMIQEFHPRDFAHRGNRSQSMSHPTESSEQQTPVGADIPLPQSPVMVRPAASAPPARRAQESAASRGKSSSNDLSTIQAKMVAPNSGTSPPRASLDQQPSSVIGPEHSPPTALRC